MYNKKVVVVSAGSIAHQFEPLPMRRCTMAQADTNQYCIWGEAGEVREIKADTAYEAFRKSGLKSIFKIERVFNLNQNILEKSKFAQEGSPNTDDVAIANLESESVQDRIRLRRNPIISPDELDELMQAMRKEATASEAEQEAAPASTLAPAPDHFPIQLASNELPVVPPPTTAVQEEVASPVGLDVHNDGFDEIIPANAAAKIPAQKPQDAKEAIRAPAAALPPARELSPEEVDKLLGGKE